MNIVQWKRRARRFARLPTLWLGFIAAWAMPAVAIEVPAYKVIGQSDAVEPRDYAATQVAETRFRADFAEAGIFAFRPLLNYISGNNRRRESKVMVEIEQPALASPASQATTTSPARP